MPYEEELGPYDSTFEPPPELDALARLVIGAAIEVHRHLGPGLPEIAYHRAMVIELSDRQILFETERIVDVIYKGHCVSRAKLDLVINGVLVVELKAVDTLGPIHQLQTRTYMRLLHQQLGILINFNVPLLKKGIKRIVETHRPLV